MAQRTLLMIWALFMCCGALSGEDAPTTVRLRFVPVDTHAECGGGASFTKLCPAPGRPGALFAMVHAGLRDEFPVQDQTGEVLFRVSVLEATDERFVLEIRTGEKRKRVELVRDKSVTAEIACGRFEFYYPSSHVSSAEKTTTNKALLIVTRLPES